MTVRRIGESLRRAQPHFMTGPSDPEIIRRVLAGDIEAFGLLVDRYQDEFATYATHMTGSLDDAADVVQESFVRAYRSLRKCQDRENFKGWLFRIVSNQCKTHVSRAARRRTEPLAVLNSSPSGDNPEHDAVMEDLRQHVQSALGRLPVLQREALVLRYLDDLGISEVARLLALSVSAVKMRLMRGRKALVDQLLGVGNDFAKR